MLTKSRAKYIQSLAYKKQRDADGVFIAEGPKLAAELLVTMRTMVIEVFAVEQWISGNQPILEGLAVTSVQAFELERMSQLSTTNQVLVLLQKPDPVVEPVTSGRITLALDAIQDPGNLGTIIRIADWFGVSQIVCGPETTDAYGTKSVQASMGSIARVRLVQLDLGPFLQQHHAVGLYAAVLNGADVRKMQPLEQGIIVIGNESKGVSAELLNLVDQHITIPRFGEAESLNAAVATGILLSHLI